MIINIEHIEPDQDIITSIDYSDGTSQDIVSVDKHLYQNYQSTEHGFEIYKYNRDGTGDYKPVDIHFDTIQEVEDYLISIQCE